MFAMYKVISYLSKCYVSLEVEKLNAVFRDVFTVDEAATRLKAPRNSLRFFEEMNTEVGTLEELCCCLHQLSGLSSFPILERAPKFKSDFHTNAM